MGNTNAPEGAWPVLVEEINLDQPLPALPERTTAGDRYRTALVIAKLHGAPVAVAETPVTPGVSTPPTLLAALLWPRIAHEVNAHLRDDGLPEVAMLNPMLGLGDGRNGREPACQRFTTGGLTADDVTVVIPTRASSPVLVDLIHSLLSARVSPAAVVLADLDPAARAVTRRIGRVFADATASVRVVPAHRPVAAHARNVGVAAAETSVVAFLDDHVVPDPGWLDGILRGFGRDDRVEAVSGPVMPASLDTAAQVWMHHLAGLGHDISPRLFDLAGDTAHHPLYPYLSAAYGAGANFAIRRATLAALGGFDERLGPGTAIRRGEDDDVLIRLVLAGHVLAYEPQALVLDHHRATDDDLRRAVFGHGRGLGAALWKQAAAKNTKREMARLALRGMRHLLDSSSPGTGRFHGDAYPASLRVAELAGIVTAPVSYARTRTSPGTPLPRMPEHERDEHHGHDSRRGDRDRPAAR